MANNGKLEARITVPTGGWDFTITETGGGGASAAITVPAFTYYHSSDGSNSNTLPEAIKTQLDASSLNATYTVSIAAGESGTGKYTISATGGSVTSFAFTWTDTEIRDLLGFSGSESGTLSYTGDNQAEALWLPDEGYQKKNGGIGGSWVTDQQIVNTANGNVYSVMGRKYRRTRIVWPMTARNKTWAENETTTNESFETFLEGIWGTASWATSTGPIRFHPDADADTATDYSTWSVLGLESWDPSELQEHWAGGRWIIELPHLIEVPT